MYIQGETLINLSYLILHCCVLIVSIGHASCRWPNKRVCPVSDQKHNVFRVEGYRETGNN